MKMKPLWSSIALLSLGVGLAAPAAHAADASTGTGTASTNAASAGTGLYVGGAISFNHANGLGGKIDSALANQGFGSSSSSDSSSTNPSLRLGYQFNPNFAIEGTYDRLGTMGVQSSLSSPAADTASGSWKSHGLGLHALGILPINPQWSVYGRLGVEQWHTRLDLNSNAGGPTALSNTDSTTSLAVGVGASYALTRNLDATAELIHYNRVGDAASTGRTGLNQFSVGLRYHFL
ncbi:outer membrane beta-barrel protein [Variovorax terrae]|uniref:Outer membrane beta-barrel protein n=1 Tax=Variovorax terrae TaxID=2923278 RepID=A0A9X1VZ96_9BURK|nr:outer membrane beta-barrel protein [Variovorax terrae]MCJ0765690.1 outer membrane beta-barrel protein [Variovorax terrae]